MSGEKSVPTDAVKKPWTLCGVSESGSKRSAYLRSMTPVIRVRARFA